MERAELVELLSAEGLALLDSLPEYDDAGDVVHLVSALREAGHSPTLVAAVLTQSRLRAKARSKFGEFACRMLFTEAGLEQATRLRVAAGHAGRYEAAGLTRIADLGCGLGGDAMAFAGLGAEVTAVDSDEVTAALAAYNLAPFPQVTVRHTDATAVDLAGFDAVYLDPARRTAGHTDTRRATDPASWSPSLDFVFDVSRRIATGVKLSPGLDRGLIPPDAEAQWVSVDGQVVETGLWFGELTRPGVKRAALVLHRDGAAELTAGADSADAASGALGDYLWEPDGAVIRARLIGDLARRMGARMVSESIAYLTTDAPLETPFASGFRVTEMLPLDERVLKKALRARGIGVLEVKKRGVDIDPAPFRTRMGLRGHESATLILTRVAGRHTAILAERLPQT